MQNFQNLGKKQNFSKKHVEFENFQNLIFLFCKKNTISKFPNFYEILQCLSSNIGIVEVIQS